MEIRSARREDLGAIVAMIADDQLGSLREVVGPELDPAYVAAFEMISADPNQLLLVADDGGRAVATLQVSFIPGISRRGMLRAQIEAVRVNSSMRGEGLGRTLVEWAVAEARRRGCGLVQLTTDRSRTRAHSFYQDLGFEPTHLGMKLKL